MHIKIIKLYDEIDAIGNFQKRLTDLRFVFEKLKENDSFIKFVLNSKVQLV